MRATKKLLALILAVCMLIGMPLSINVSAADTEPLHIEEIYLGEKGTDDQDYLCIQFSEQATLQTRYDPKLITLIVYDLNGNKTARMEIADTTVNGLPGASDASGLFKVRLVSNAYDNMTEWLEANYLNKRSEGRRLVCNIAEGYWHTAGDGWIQTFKGNTTGTYLKNDNADYILPDIGNEALAIDISDNYTVTLESVSLTTHNGNEDDITLKFSEPVKMDTSAAWQFGICFMKDGQMIGKKLRVGSWTHGQAASDVLDTWQLWLYDADASPVYSDGAYKIKRFIRSEYTEEMHNQGVEICFFIQEQTGLPVDGLINYVYTDSGKKLKVDQSLWSGTDMETFYFPITDDLYEAPEVTLVGATMGSNDGTATWTNLIFTFSQPIKIPNKIYDSYGLCVVLNGQVVSSTKLNVGGWRSDHTQYSTTWRMNMMDYNTTTGYASIPAFIAGEYTAERQAQGAKLYAYIADESGGALDGLINIGANADGTQIRVTNTERLLMSGREATFIELDMSYKPTAYLGDDTQILVSTEGLPGTGWTSYTYLRAYGNDGAVLTLGDNQSAEWSFTFNTNLTMPINGTARPFAAALLLKENFGVKTYSDIVAKLDEAYGSDYHLELVTVDTVKDGVVNPISKYNYVTSKYDACVFADAQYSDASTDVAVIPFGEIVTIESVDVYDSGKAIITFSHDIDMDTLMAATTGNQDFFLTVSEVGMNSYVTAENQTSITDIQPYNGSQNKIIGTLNASRYEEMMAYYNNGKDSNNWTIRMRIEMETNYADNTGMLPLNNHIVAQDANVLSPFMQVRGLGQTWTDVNIIDAADGAFSINGVQTSDLSEITKAPAGSEIIMIDNAVIEADGFRVPTDVVLDLNGKTITMSESTAIFVGGTIMDNTDGGALIKVVNKNTATVDIPGSNPQMPLYDTADGGYRLFHKEFKNQGVKEGTQENSMRYGVHLHFDNSKAYELLAAGGTDVKLTLKLYAEDYVDVPLYTFQESTLKEYGQSCLNATDEKPLSGKTIVLTVFGMDKLNGTSLDVSATLNFMDTVAIGEAVPVVPVA